MRAALAIINPEIGFEWIDTKPLTDACPGEFGVSRPGTIAAAKIFPKDADPIIVTSIYAPWELPHSSTNSSWKVGNADASAHRIVSDLSSFIGSVRGHRIIATGDINSLKYYGENGSDYWSQRHSSIFHRMEAIGMPHAGPLVPHGRQASPWPDELPQDSDCVPTYHSTSQTPTTATATR